MATLGTSGLPEDRNPSTADLHDLAPSDPKAVSRRSVKRAAPVARPTQAPKRKRRLRPLANLAVMAIAGGIVATIAIPAYAFNPASSNQASFGTSVIDDLKKSNSQSAHVSGAINGPVASGDTFSATTEQQLAD